MMNIVLVMFSMFNIFLCKYSNKNWFNPAMIYSLMWSFFCVVPCLLWGAFEWSYSGLIWILASCTCMILGQFFSRKIYIKKQKIFKKNKTYNLNIDTFRIIIILLLFFSTLYVCYGILKKGFNLSVFFNMEQLLSINNYSALNRYFGNESISVLNQINLIIEYSLPLLGGLLFNISKEKKDKIISILTLFPITLGFIVSNAKAGFIASVFNFFISFMLSYYLVNKKYKEINKKNITILIVLFLVFFCALFLSMCLRAGNLDISTINYVRERILVYAFGQMKAFDEWFVCHEPIKYTLGSSTYMWIFNLLGLVTRQQGVYGWANTIRTNVFTVFRGVITDFGFFGGLVYFFIRGFISGYICSRFESKEELSPIIYALYAANYLFIFYGMIISPWIYTTYFMTFILFIIIVWVSKKVKIKWR